MVAPLIGERLCPNRSNARTVRQAVRCWTRTSGMSWNACAGRWRRCAPPRLRRARIRSASLAAAFLLVLGCVDLVTGAVVGSLGSAHWGWRARRSLPSPCRAWFSLFWRCGCMIIEAFRSRRGGREAAAMLLRERSALGAVVGVRSCSSCRRRPAHGSATARPARRRVHPAHRARGTDRPRMRSLGCDSGSAPCPSRDRMHGLTSLLSQLRHAVWRSGGCDCQSV